MDPGDGSGKWQPVDPAHPQYLEFRADGSLVSSVANSPTRYKLLSDSTLLFYRSTDSFPQRYHFTKTLLTLNPPCYEPCGMHYAAVK